MSKGKKAKAEVQHSPLPWRETDSSAILDAKGDRVADVVGLRTSPEEDWENIKLVVEAVNEHERLSSENRKLHEIACALTRSRDAAIKEADKLRELVREMVDKLDDAWDFVNRIDTKAEEVCDGLHSAMEKARSAIGEELPE